MRKVVPRCSGQSAGELGRPPHCTCGLFNLGLNSLGDFNCHGDFNAHGDFNCHGDFNAHGDFNCHGES